MGVLGRSRQSQTSARSSTVPKGLPLRAERAAASAPLVEGSSLVCFVRDQAAGPA